MRISYAATASISSGGSARSAKISEPSSANNRQSSNARTQNVGAESRSKAPENAFRDVSSFTSFFRSKLIEEFHLLDNLAEPGFSAPAATVTSRDFQDLKIRQKILNNAPISLIKFPQVKRKQQDESHRKVDRRLTRTKNMDTIPAGAWAAWLISLPIYKSIQVAAIVINGVSLGIMTQFWNDAQDYWLLFEALTIANRLCLMTYYLDIVLKWVDDFMSFWKDEWNIADLCIDLFVTIPEIVSWTYLFSHVSDQNAFFTALRVFAVFKLVMKFETFKIIIITIIQAIGSMGYIMMFVFMMALVFAVIGTALYEEYTHAALPGLVYQDYFKSIKTTLVTLFQLITLDQWDVIDRNLYKVTPIAYNELYIISWVFLGAFIFRNIFVGVMVHNFDRISDTLKTEKESQLKRKRLEKMRRRLKNQLAVHGNIQAMNDRRAGHVNSHEEIVSKSNITGLDNDRHTELLRNVQRLMIASHDVSLGWDATVQETLASLALDLHDETLWPRDTLFKYLQLMETLMENMREYQELTHLASKMHIHPAYYKNLYES